MLPTLIQETAFGGNPSDEYLITALWEDANYQNLDVCTLSWDGGAQSVPLFGIKYMDSDAFNVIVNPASALDPSLEDYYTYDFNYNR